MKDATHTPGPWEIWGNLGEMDLAVGPVAGGVAVAQIVTVNGIGIMDGETAQLGAANARLIAAAPALLAALESMVSTALKVEDKAWASAIDRAGQTRPCDAARAALEAAKGGAQ